MQKPPIATIINFCTIEARFLKPCIEQCRHFSRQIIIPVCDHFFNGVNENHELLSRIYSSFPDCQFIEYPWMPNEMPQRIVGQMTPDHFWHNVSRMVGSQFLNDDIDMVLFLDADELPDGKKFSEWLDASDYAQHSVLKMANYWYFREPRFQSLHWEDSVVLAQKSRLDPDVLLHETERDAIYDFLPGPKRRSVTGPDGKPMFHHFSWVRTKDEMMKKVLSWGHRGDRNWGQLVENEFSAPFSGKDFVHGYYFQECRPLFEIDMERFDFSPDGNSHPQITQLTKQELIRHLDRPKGWLNKLFNLLFKEPLAKLASRSKIR